MNAKIDKLKLALANAKAVIQGLKGELRTFKANYKEALKAAKGTPTKKAVKPAAKVKPAVKKVAKKSKSAS